MTLTAAASAVTAPACPRRTAYIGRQSERSRAPRRSTGRAGSSERLAAPADYGDVALSPDGMRLAVSVSDPARSTRHRPDVGVPRPLSARSRYSGAEHIGDLAQIPRRQAVDVGPVAEGIEQQRGDPGAARAQHVGVIEVADVHGPGGVGP